MSMSVNRPITPPPVQPQNRVGGMQPSQTTQPYQAGNGLPDGGNNLYRGSSVIPESAFVDADTVTVTPDNIGRLGGDVLLTPQQTKELYEKGSLQVRREFQTAESNEGFMTLTAKLAAALVGPSRSVAAIQIDPMFLEMIKDPNAKVGMGYTQVSKETWTVMPSPEQKNLEPPIMGPKPTPPYDVPGKPALTPKPDPVITPEPVITPKPEGEVYRIARTPENKTGLNTALVKEYRDKGFPPLGNGEKVGDTTYDGAAAEAILGREMQVPFQYVGRANLEFNSLNITKPGDETSKDPAAIKRVKVQANARAWIATMAKEVGFEYHVNKNGKAYLKDPEGNRVLPDGKVFKSAVAKEVGLGSFKNYQNLQEHVKFVQAVGYTDPLNTLALSGQVADRSPKQAQNDLKKMFGGHSLDNTRHEYFTANDLENQGRLDEYKSDTQNTAIPEKDLADYQKLYNTYNSPDMSLDDIRAAKPTLMDAYALHSQKFQPSLNITFSDGKANVPESSVKSVLNARIVLESNTSNGREDELLYGEASLLAINIEVDQVFGGGNTGMELRSVDGNGQEVLIRDEDVSKFMQFLNNGQGPVVKDTDGNYNYGTDTSITAGSAFNDVEVDITKRYNDAHGKGYETTTVGNGFVRRPGLVPNPETTGGVTPVAPNPETTGGVTPDKGESLSKFTSQSIYEAIHIDIDTAKSGKRFPPGTSQEIEKRITDHAAELTERLANKETIMVKTMTPPIETVALTEDMIKQMVTDSKAALLEMDIMLNRDINDNPQDYEPRESKEDPIKALSASEKASSQLGQLNDYMRAALRDDSIQPAERDAIVQRVEIISANLFADLSNKGVVSGPYSPDTLNQVTPEMIREKIKDPVQANSIISAVENLNYTASQIGMISDLNHATSLSRRVSDLSKRLDNFEQIEVAKKAFTGELGSVAKLEDPKIFNSFVAEAYNLQPHGTSPEVDAHYETLRSAAKNGELPFPPTIQVVDPSELNGADGAYVNVDGKLESGQIMISKDILNQPERLRNVFSEEMFHHLEHMSAISDIGDKTNVNNRGANFEAIGDEGRAAVYALRSIQNNERSTEQIASAADKGRNQASTAQSGGNITMEGNGSDRGTITTASGVKASIEFNTRTPEELENNPQDTPPAGEEVRDPGIGRHAAVDMDVTPRNAHPTRDVDMTGVDAELFNAAPPLQMDQATANRLDEHPDTEGAKKFSIGDVVKGLPNVLFGAAKTYEAYAERLQELVQKHFLGQNGVANNLSNVSNLMSQAQSLNGYHNTNPDLKLTDLSANYSRRPVYDNQNAKDINANSDQYHKQQMERIAQNNAAQEARNSGHKAVVG